MSSGERAQTHKGLLFSFVESVLDVRELHRHDQANEGTLITIGSCLMREEMMSVTLPRAAHVWPAGRISQPRFSPSLCGDHIWLCLSEECLSFLHYVISKSA